MGVGGELIIDGGKKMEKVKAFSSACLLFTVILMITPFLSANAKDVTIYPTVPGTNIKDYSKPGIRIEGNTAYPTIPGTKIRDYSRPGVRIEDDTIYPTIPGTNIRDFTQPGLKMEYDED